VPLYGIPQLNAKNQSNEHICANSIACNAIANHWRYAVLLLFGIEKAKYGREITQATVAIQLKKARLYRAFFIVQYQLLSKKKILYYFYFEHCSFIFGYSK
jgi:hypothetical protein